MKSADGSAAVLLDRATWKSWLTTAQAADYLGVSERTLEEWRQKRTGPAYYKKMDGKLILYRREELDAWIVQAFEHVEPTAL